jgi:Amt family ammonium transporter
VKDPPEEPHAVPFVLLGSALLWFGWFGFNAGSALTASNNVAAQVFANTQVAAAAGMATWCLIEVTLNGATFFSGQATAIGAASGVVAGCS